MIKYIQNKKINYNRIEEVLVCSQESNQFTNRGPCKKRLENLLKRTLSIQEDKTIVCVSNGTLALHALMLFYKKRGLKKFISPSFTFPSCVVGGFNTKVVDISLETFSFKNDQKLIEENDCLIITNLFGTYPDNLEWILDKCKKSGTKVILDNASSPMTKINGINFCNLGDAAFGSLHHTKFMGFGEGGFIVIDKQHEEEINEILGFGFSINNYPRLYNKSSSNFKMADPAAAFIIQHIENYDLNRHQEIQKFLSEEVNKIKNVNLFNFKKDVFYGNLPLLFDRNIDESIFLPHNLEAKKYYYPIKKHKNSLSLYKRIINLPLHSLLSDYDIEVIVKVLREVSK
jgi:dTDP-4-amino-4,6-dideoxygalactose transaminase